MRRQFTEEGTQMANIMQNPLVIKEMQIETSMRWNSAPIILSIKKKLPIPDPDVDKDGQKEETVNNQL